MGRWWWTTSASPIRDGDVIYIGKNQVHSICNTGEDDFIEFLAFASQC